MAETVSASALTLHLDCTRAYVGKLEAEGVLHRAPDGSGFDTDASLRRERQQSTRAAADAEHAAAKAALLRFKIEEKKRELVRRADDDAPDRRHCRCHPYGIVEPACAVCAAW